MKGAPLRLFAVGLLAAVPIAGCGGGESYDDVLRGLRNAALSKKTYDAIRHADDLDASQKAVVNAFCSVATQLADNGETVTEEEYFDRIEAQATGELGFAASTAVKSAATRLRAIYDLSQVGGSTARLYMKACYGL